MRQQKMMARGPVVNGIDALDEPVIDLSWHCFRMVPLLKLFMPPNESTRKEGASAQTSSVLSASVAASCRIRSRPKCLYTRPCQRLRTFFGVSENNGSLILGSLAC